MKAIDEFVRGREFTLDWSPSGNYVQVEVLVDPKTKEIAIAGFESINGVMTRCKPMPELLKTRKTIRQGRMDRDKIEYEHSVYAAWRNGRH